MNIPNEKMQYAIDSWVNHGAPHPSGLDSFLRALLTNNLKATWMMADQTNRKLLAEWAAYVYWELPSGSHGSEEALLEWHMHRGLAGLADARAAERSEIAPKMNGES